MSPEERKQLATVALLMGKVAGAITSIQPARAIVNFVNKLMMSTSNGAGGRPADMV